MARQAEAEREKRATMIHAEGELIASEKLSQAAAVISREPGAMTLRYLQTLNEIAAELEVSGGHSHRIDDGSDTAHFTYTYLPLLCERHRSWSVPDMNQAAPPSGSVLIPLWVLVTITAVFLLREAAPLLIPIAVAVLISYVLEPAVAWLVSYHVPRVAGTAVALLVASSAVGWGAHGLTGQAVEVVDSLPVAAERVRGAFASVIGDDAVRKLESTLGGTSRGDTDVDSTVSTIAALLQRGVPWAFSIAVNVLVVVFLVMFLLLSGRRPRERLIEAWGRTPDGRSRLAIIADEINAQIERFLLARLATAAIVAVLTWLALTWLGTRSAAVWGILAGVFNSIPYFGPVIVSGGLLVVGLAQGGGLTDALQMAAAALAITSLEGWLLTPLLLGKTERMSALAVFLGLLLWTWMWGAWGTILAVPMLVVVKSVADHVDTLKPVARLMAR